jgi:DNA repair exonuclease SbcCD nuclease subunit
VPSAEDVRVLLVADTHIGIDDPARPRVQRRRRGPDFLERFERALEPALEGRVDAVVHGGDLLYRSRVPASLVQRALDPLVRVAARGVPVFLVPGNHERGRIPFPLLARHPRVHVFHRPGTFTGRLRGLRVAFSGFPFARDVGPTALRELVAGTAWRAHESDIRLLCFHQAVEGATVGAHHYVFRPGREVVAGRDLPAGFAAFLTGHIHRSQVLTHDLAGRALPAPVLYPGSVERTSFAEREEAKGSLVLELAPGRDGGRLVRWTFVGLHARPMVGVELDVRGLSREHVERSLARRFAALDPHAVVRVRIRGEPAPGAERGLAAATLRRLAPPTMNVEVARAAHRR